MQLIVITWPDRVEQEQQICCDLFALGLQTLHLRKPGAGMADLRRWLQQLPERYHGRVMLHTHHALAQEFAVKGLHFTAADSAMAVATAKGHLTFSTSFHALEDILKSEAASFDYAFLSPIFRSISKKDYPAAFSLPALKEALPEAKLPVMALGGITADKLLQVKELGFAGAAVLGAVWEHPQPVNAFKALLNALCLSNSPTF